MGRKLLGFLLHSFIVLEVINQRFISYQWLQWQFGILGPALISSQKRFVSGDTQPLQTEQSRADKHRPAQNAHKADHKLVATVKNNQQRISTGTHGAARQQRATHQGGWTIVHKALVKILSLTDRRQIMDVSVEEKYAYSINPCIPASIGWTLGFRASKW